MKNLTYRGTMLIDVDIIKYDGTNKEAIIEYLGHSIVDFYSPLYFQVTGVYFIIPAKDKNNWFILNEEQYKLKIR